LAVVFALYTIARFGYDGVQPPGMIPRDFQTFYNASNHLNQGLKVYTPEDASPYKYSPTFLAIFASTFHRFPLFWSWLLWCTVSIAAWSATCRIFWSRALLGKGAPSLKTALALIAAAVIFSWHGYLEHFSYGQADCLLLGIFVLAAWVRSKRYGNWLSAFLIGSILVTKPQMAILLAYFVVQRDFEVLVLGLLTTLVLLLLPGFFWGWPRLFSLFADWRHCLEAQTAEFITGNLNQSLAAAIARLSGRRDWVHALNMLSVLGAGALTLAFAQRKRNRSSVNFNSKLACWSLALYLVTSPLSWRWITFAWMPIFITLAAQALKDKKRPLIILLSIFMLNGILLQAIIAHALGIAEVDDLSRFGLYALGNLLLLSASTVEQVA
jgi:hypothetical protein